MDWIGAAGSNEGTQWLGTKLAMNGRLELRRRYAGKGSARKWGAVGGGDLSHQDQHEVDECPNSEPAKGHKLEDAETRVPEVEAVNTESTEKEAQEDSRGEILA